MANTKFIISEKDGVEFEFNSEYIPESDDVLYVVGQSETVKDRITFPNNVMVPKIVTEDITVTLNKILVMHSPCFDANLILDGDLVLV